MFNRINEITIISIKHFAPNLVLSVVQIGILIYYLA